VFELDQAVNFSDPDPLSADPRNSVFSVNGPATLTPPAVFSVTDAPFSKVSHLLHPSTTAGAIVKYNICSPGPSETFTGVEE
jgi:hypothetical protein